MIIHFSIGFHGEKLPIFGSGNPKKVEKLIKDKLPELRKYVSESVKQLEAQNCQSSGVSGCSSSYTVAKYDLKQYFPLDCEVVNL